MTSEETCAATRQQWRELGFYYDRDDINRVWLIIGSRTAILRFCQILRNYAADSRRRQLSEHEHYGPYQYLTVMTWNQPQLDRRGIAGTLKDLQRLAALIELKVRGAADGSAIRIAHEYTASPDYALEIQLRSDPFDPSTEDPEC